MTKLSGNRSSSTRKSHSSFLWLLVSLSLVGLLTLPVLSIAVNIWYGPGESWDHIYTYLLPNYTVNTLQLILGVGILSVVLGVVPAYIVARRVFVGSKVLQWLLVLPLAVPNYITAYAYAGFFENGGTLHRWLGVYFDVMGIPGLTVVLATSLYPYVYLAARAFFSESMQSQLQAARMLGYTGFETFRKVALPMSRPAVAAGLLLVLMEVVSDYGASHYFGVQTFSTAIFRSWFSLHEPQTALFLSAILCCIVIVLITAERMIRGKRKFAFRNSTLASIQINKAGFSALVSLLVCFVPIVAGFALPVFQMLLWAFKQNFAFNSSLIEAAFHSFGLSLLAAAIAVCASFVVVFTSRWSESKFANFTSKGALLGYSLPAVVIAVGIMTATIGPEKEVVLWLRSIGFEQATFFINNSIIGLLFAYTVRFLAVAYGPVEAAEARQGDKLAGAARSLGYSKVSTALRVQIPILRTSALVAGLLVFVDVMKELPLTLLMKPYDVMTLSVKAYQFASDERIAESAVPALCIVAVGIIPIVVLNSFLRKTT